MICGCSPVTFNKYRVENNTLYFDGRDAELNISQYEVTSGFFDDACFATEFLSGKMKNFALLNQKLEILKTYFDSNILNSKTSWKDISFGVLSSDPDHLGAICAARPFSLFSVIPYNWNDLEIIGRLLNKEIASPLLAPLQCERRYENHLGMTLENFTPEPFVENSPILLNWAKAVLLKHEPYSLFYSLPYDDGFCDRFITGEYDDSCDVCVMTYSMVESCFGYLPISYRTCGMPIIPTMVETTEEFRKKTGYNGKTINAVVTGSYNRILNQFMGFWGFVSNKPYFWTKRKNSHKRQTVFTADGFGYISHDDLEVWRERFGLARTV